ncbi:MAG: nitroreductase family protein [bacterium]|nr:nitroreductase family protein [bacterium]
MTLNELALRRESCRAYLADKAVPHELLEDMIKTAILSPNAGNGQSWRFYLCEGETAKKVASLCMAIPGNNTWAPECPAFIVISSAEKVSNAVNGKPRDLRIADAGIAAAYLSLAAAEKGLDTCIIGSADEEGVKALLGVAPERRVHLIVAVGYGKEAPSLKKDRLPYDELVTVCR